MSRRHPIKPLRVWIIGASVFATIFLALSCKYDFWAMKTYELKATKFEQSLYFGLWRSCNDTRPGETNMTTNRPMFSVCKEFGDHRHAGIVGTPSKWFQRMRNDNV